MLKPGLEVLFVNGDRGLFEAFKERAIRFTIMPAIDGHEAGRLAENEHVSIALFEMNAEGLQNGRLLAAKDSNQPKLIFYSRWGNAPFFRQRLDEDGFETAAIISTRLLLKYADEILRNIELQSGGEPREDGTLEEGAATLPLVDEVFHGHLVERLKFVKSLAWRDVEAIIEELSKPFGCTIDLVLRTRNGEADILAIAEPSACHELRYILQARWFGGKLLIEPVRELRFLRSGLARWCAATTGPPYLQDWERHMEHRWELEIWDYEELKDWSLRQGWWSA